MFSFGRKKPIDQDDESIKEIEKIVHALDQDGSGRIRIKDLETALQRIDEDTRSKPEIKNQVRSFSEWSSFDLMIHAIAILHRLSHCYSSQIFETERGPNRWREIRSDHARTAKTIKIEVTSRATPILILSVTLRCFVFSFEEIDLNKDGVGKTADLSATSYSSPLF